MYDMDLFYVEKVMTMVMMMMMMMMIS